MMAKKLMPDVDVKIIRKEDRFIVRKKIAKELEEMGHIVKIEDYQNKVPMIIPFTKGGKN